MKSYWQTNWDGWQQGRAECRVAGLKKPDLLPHEGLPAHLAVSTPRQRWLEGRNLPSAGAAVWLVWGKRNLLVKAGKRKSSLIWAGCRHWLCHDTILNTDMKCKAVSFTWGLNCTILSVTIAKALQVKIDLRRVPKLPETWYFLPGGIGVPLSIACQCKTEAAVFTKLTNGPQVKHWAICETAFFLQALTSLLRLLAGECSVILSGLTYFNIMSFLIAFLEKICLQLHPVSLLRCSWC